MRFIIDFLKALINIIPRWFYLLIFILALWVGGGFYLYKFARVFCYNHFPDLRESQMLHMSIVIASFFTSTMAAGLLGFAFMMKNPKR